MGSHSKLLLALCLSGMATGLVLQFPVTHAQVAGVSGPAALWWDTGVWNDRYPGSVLRVSVHIYNSAQVNQTAKITSLSVVTPWQTYSAAGLPVTICEGCTYLYQFNMTIPTNQAIGGVTFTTQFSGTYSTGTALCSSKGNQCTESVPVTIDQSPTSLQSKVNNYNDVYLPIGVAIPSLVAIIFIALYATKKPKAAGP